VALYGGIDPGNVAGVGNPQPTFGVISTSAQFTRVYYCLLPAIGQRGPCHSVNGESYLGSDGATCLPIYEVTFATNLLLGQGITYDFAADGTVLGGLTGCVGGQPCGWYNHATNAANAGTTQTGSDNLFLNWATGQFLTQGYITENSSTGCSPSAVLCGGWDKSSDMNVIVTGSAVPEPGTVSMFLLGGLAVALAKVRPHLPLDLIPSLAKAE
jgi:hypothetical protein